MTKTELKHRAQDQLMGWMVEAIDRAEADGDKELAAEMLRQARRAMTMFGVVSYAGLGEDIITDVEIEANCAHTFEPDSVMINVCTSCGAEEQEA